MEEVDRVLFDVSALVIVLDLRERFALMPYSE